MADPIRNSEKLARPLYPEPSPGPELVVESETFEVGSGSEVPPSAADRARLAAERVRDNFNEVADKARHQMNRVSERASELAEDASERLQHLREQWNERYPELRRQAVERMDDARRRARDSAYQIDARARRMPLQTIGIAAIAGLVLGITLRIWRASRG